MNETPDWVRKLAALLTALALLILLVGRGIVSMATGHLKGGVRMGGGPHVPDGPQAVNYGAMMAVGGLLFVGVLLYLAFHEDD